MDVLKSNLSCYALRLHPDSDLVLSLEQYVKTANIAAAFILTCVGSLKQAKIRLASASPGKEEYVLINEPVEIVSLVGTLSSSGEMHLHISVADNSGAVVGGHLMRESSIVHTTVEIVIGNCENLYFNREFDKCTGYKELAVVHKQNSLL